MMWYEETIAIRAAEGSGNSPSHDSPGIPASQQWVTVQDALVALLRSVASAIARLKPEEFEALLRGRGRLAYVAREERSTRARTAAASKRSTRAGTAAASKRPRAGKRSVSPEELKEIERRFLASPDRESAHRVLEDSGMKKHDLVSLARSLAVPVSSKRTVQEIRFKLVEGVVGTRLRSEALRQADVR